MKYLIVRETGTKKGKNGNATGQDDERKHDAEERNTSRFETCQFVIFSHIALVPKSVSSTLVPHIN